MARVEPSDVELVIPDVDADSDTLQAMIDDASAWIDSNLAGRLSDDTLTSIEKYLAAHLVVQATNGAGGQVVQEQVDDTSERRQRTTDDKGVSYYLRIAASFDSTGRVAHYWMGTPLLRYRVGKGFAIRGGGNA